jgi:serpin B
LLANALYFEAVWANPFLSDFNRKDYFTNADKSQTLVELMCEADYMNYLNCGSFSLCEKSYGNEAFSMVFLLPDDQVTLDKSISSLCQMDWKELNGKLTKNRKYVMLNVPKFEMKGQTYDLIPTLKDMGMQIPFTGLADFRNMTDEAALAISKVNQKTALMLNEQGTQAAAVTKVEFDVVSTEDEPQPVNFILNRPFAFLIKENSTGAILFTGFVNSL